MDLQSIKAALAPELEKVNNCIAKSLKSDIDLLEKVNSRILSHSGKQLRPIVGLLCARACSGGFISGDTILYATASELLHNATLLHDDVADEGTQRRGVPTVMSLLGGRASVLLGDYWLVKGMENILQAVSSSSQVIRIYSKTLSDLAEGELLQLQKADLGDTDEQDYYKIIFNKTASLFEATGVAGAISVGASREKISAIKSYAKNIGLAFQVRDDIFDYRHEEAIGKPVGSDLKEKKITLPLLGALANVSRDKEMSIRRMVSEIDAHPEYLETIAAFVIDNGGIEYAERKSAEFIDKAVIALRPLGESGDISMLKEIASFVACRHS